MPTAGPLHRDSLLQRSKILMIMMKLDSIPCIGGNGLDFFQTDPITAQYLQPTSPSPGLPIAVSDESILSKANSDINFLHHRSLGIIIDISLP